MPEKIPVIILKFGQCGFTIKLFVQKNSDRMAKSVEPDQTASWAVWPVSSLFAQTCLSKNYESLCYKKMTNDWATALMFLTENNVKTNSLRCIQQIWPSLNGQTMTAITPTCVHQDCKWAPSSEFLSSSIPSWQILTAHARPFRGARDLAFCLKVPLDSLLVWASSGGSGETAQACLNLRCSHRR